MTPNTDTNEKPTNENQSTHKYNSDKEHLKICTSCYTQKQKINKDYYDNNTDSIKNKRKAIRDRLNNVLDSVDKDPSQIETITEEEKSFIEEVKSIPIGKINPDNYMIKYQSHKFQFPKGLERIFSKYSRKEISRGLILIGHAGNGKTESVIAYAFKNNIPLLNTAMHDEMRSTDLLGSFTLNKTFELGNFPKAIEIANHPDNKSHMCILLMDECNCQSNTVQKLSNSNLNFRQGITIPLIDKRFVLNDGCKILVIGTMNYSSYAGTYQLNLEYNSRFGFYKYPTMPDQMITSILKQKNINQQTIESLLITNKEILKAFEEEKISQPIDPRGLLKFAEDYNENIKDGLKNSEAISEAIELELVGRYLDNKEDLKFVSELIETNFDTSNTSNTSENNSEEDK